jgi:hypothetical protein
MRLALRGHMLLSENAIESGAVENNFHVFGEDVLIPAGMYVLLITGLGESKWTKTKDGGLVYYCFMNREEPVWRGSELPIHLLSTQHSFTEKRDAMLLLR